MPEEHPHVVLNDRLLSLLHGHQVSAELRDGRVYLPELDRWAELHMRPARSSHLMAVRVSAPGGEHVDRWAALGEEPEAAARDGLAAFVRGGFHVLLAALWGLYEPEQVEWVERTVGTATWDLYLGPYTGRVAAGGSPLRAPSDLVERVLAALDAHLTGETHFVRVYYAAVNGQVTVETLVDDAPSEGMHRAVAEAEWTAPSTGFASLRWFSIARRRGDGPAHLRTGSCAGV
jgi:Family of unknown function (DUF6348)